MEERQRIPVDVRAQEVRPPTRNLDFGLIFSGIMAMGVLFLAFIYYEVQIHYGVKIALVTILLLYLLIPITFHFWVDFQKHVVFLPWLRWPHNVNFSAPETEGLEGARNFYLSPEPGINIGVWHILPRTFVNQSRGQENEFWEDVLRNGEKPVILYMHGNTASRAAGHRVELYHLLQDLDYHVLCLDYRGYADSTSVPLPTETGVVADARQLYEYARRVVGNGQKSPKIIIWGHSLGTGVSSHMVASLCLAGTNKPDALILESPFTSIGEEVRYHSLSKAFRYLPGFDYIFINPLVNNDLAFRSDLHIANIDIPIAILHATDDPVIPFHMGVSLFNIGLQTRRRDAPPIYFKMFLDGYEHKFICRSPDLPPLIKNFINSTVKDVWPCPGFDNLTYEEQEHDN